MRWYERNGYRLVERNWRTREGELDLIVRRGQLTVFCEVKTRRSDAYGSPAAAVTVTKQRRIRRLALLWLQQRGAGGGAIRFDVACVTPAGVEIISAAF